MCVQSQNSLLQIMFSGLCKETAAEGHTDMSTCCDYGRTAASIRAALQYDCRVGLIQILVNLLMAAELSTGRRCGCSSFLVDRSWYWLLACRCLAGSWQWDHMRGSLSECVFWLQFSGSGCSAYQLLPVESITITGCLDWSVLNDAWEKQVGYQIHQ